jgi:hypothetical protein
MSAAAHGIAWKRVEALINLAAVFDKLFRLFFQKPAERNLEAPPLSAFQPRTPAVSSRRGGQTFQFFAKHAAVPSIFLLTILGSK